MMAAPVKLAPDQRSLETGRPATLFPVRIAPGTATQQYAVSADGLRFLVNLDAEQDARSSIILIDQWKPRNSRPE